MILTSFPSGFRHAGSVCHLFTARCFLVLIPAVYILGCSIVRAEDVKSEAARITATEPAAVISGSKVTLKVRGFKLKEATELRFPMASEVKAVITEKKDSGVSKGLENKLVGDTQLLAEITFPANHPAGVLEYVIATPAGDAAGKIMVLAADAVIDETEPNNGFREAQKLQTGQSARGSIQGDKDVAGIAKRLQFVHPVRQRQRRVRSVTRAKIVPARPKPSTFWHEARIGV